MKTKLLPLLLFLFFACDDFPRDSADSFEEAKKSGLHVGVAINPPFTEFEKGNFTGIEVELIKQFARENNLKLKFVQASESQLIKKLEKHQLHLLIGGIDKKTLWSKKAGLSKSYDKKHVILIAKGENQLLYALEGFLFKSKKS